jgi:hypothetical protein
VGKENGSVLIFNLFKAAGAAFLADTFPFRRVVIVIFHNQEHT